MITPTIDDIRVTINESADDPDFRWDFNHGYDCPYAVTLRRLGIDRPFVQWIRWFDPDNAGDGFQWAPIEPWYRDYQERVRIADGLSGVAPDRAVELLETTEE